MTYKIIGGDKIEYGPSTAEELRQWIAEGRLNAQSLMRVEPDGEWRPLSAFNEFAEALEQQTRTVFQATAPPFTSEGRRREITVSDCLARGWNLWMSNFALFFATSFLVWTIGMLLQFLPLLGLLYWLLRGVLYGGLFIVVLRRVRGEETSVGEAFTGFGTRFIQLVLVGMATSTLTWLGFLFCIVPGIYLSVIWAFSIPTVADKGLDFWSAMERSRKAVSGQWSRLFVLALIAFLPVILTTVYAEVKIAAAMYDALKPLIPTSGPPDINRLFTEMNRVATDLAKTGLPLILAAKFALLFNLPFGISAIACAYEELIGKSSANRN